MYNLIVKDGLLVDPAQGIHEKMDVAISNGKVAAVEKRIISSQAEKVVDASDMIVTPGLVDIHTHCAYNIANLAIDPESSCLGRGSTTVLDVGTLGELLFTAFRRYVIESSKTRIYALLNIESLGMIELEREQEWVELTMDINERLAGMFININNTTEMIEENEDVILGVKWAHRGLKALQLARDVADKAECLLMAENHYQPETLNYMKRGDVITHLFHANEHSYKMRPHDGLLDEDKNVQSEFFKAIKRGVILDVGHGGGSFSWDVAEEAFKQGIRPHTISTDLHIGNVEGPVYDMPTTMSKFLLLGMSLDEVVKASTATPAKVIGKEDKIGTLNPGACADLTLLKLEEGRFRLKDTLEEERLARQRLLPVKVIRGGILYSER